MFCENLKQDLNPGRHLMCTEKFGQHTTQDNRVQEHARCLLKKKFSYKWQLLKFLHTGNTFKIIC